MFDTECELDLFQKVIQKLTFTPSVNLYDLQQSGIEIEIGRDQFNELLFNPKKVIHYALPDEMSKSRNRYKRILSRLTVETTNEDNPTRLFTYPKIYSDILRERQIILYNKMAEKIGFPKIKHVIPVHLMKEICTIDGVEINKEFEYNSSIKDFVYKNYPYFFAGDFKGVTFTEYIVLLNIYQNTKNRTLFMLNSTPKYSKNVERKKDWKKQVIVSIDTPQIHKIYIDTFLKVFFDTLLNDYNQISQECYQLVWAPEEYRKSKIVVQEAEKLEASYNKTESELYDLREHLLVPDLLADVEALRPLLFQIIPNVWKTLLLKYDKKIEKSRKIEFGYDNADDYEKKEVVKYCRFIEEYITHSIKDATFILHTFFN